METLKDTSTVVVEAADFLDALKIAVIYTDQKLYPGIRIDFDRDTNAYTVSSRVLNNLVSISQFSCWADFVNEERDGGIELSIKQVRDVLQVFKHSNKRPKGEDAIIPQIGIQITENEIAWFDESGIGLSIWLYACKRENDIVPVGVATSIEEIIATGDRIKHIALDQAQLQRISKAAAIVGEAPQLEGIDVSDEVEATGVVKYKTVITCGAMQSVAICYPHGTSAPTEGEEEGERQEDLSFGDADERMSLNSEGLRVVGARPLGGIS